MSYFSSAVWNVCPLLPRKWKRPRIFFRPNFKNPALNHFSEMGSPEASTVSAKIFPIVAPESISGHSFDDNDFSPLWPHPFRQRQPRRPRRQLTRSRMFLPKDQRRVSCISAKNNVDVDVDIDDEETTKAIFKLALRLCLERTDQWRHFSSAP